MDAAIGIDVGGTKTSAALVDAAGHVLHHATAPTPARDGAAAVLRNAGEMAVEMLHRGLRAEINVVGCGAGVAGTVGSDGVITHATDSLPGWAGTDVAGGLATALHLPVRVVNDVHALALGEHRFGAAAGADNSLIVAVGTGIGGAFICGGTLVTGRTGTAGAIGHMPVPADEPRPCPCGRAGHIEAYASGPAIVAEYVARGGSADRLEHVAAGALAGDQVARQVITDAAAMLGTVLGGLANLLDPEVIVLGGGVAQIGALLFDPLERALRQQTLTGPDTVPVRPAALGRFAGVIGAATLALSA
jgi:glucokinase